ncbi:hypothetical protein V2G26_016061 [Clonostachys chloroleuca]
MLTGLCLYSKMATFHPDPNASALLETRKCRQVHRFKMERSGLFQALAWDLRKGPVSQDKGMGICSTSIRTITHVGLASPHQKTSGLGLRFCKMSSPPYSSIGWW